MSRREIFLLLVYAGLMGGAGCARKMPRVLLPNLAIPVNCASEITLVGCDARVTPPKCRSAVVRYRKGCEEVVVTRK